MSEHRSDREQSKARVKGCSKYGCLCQCWDWEGDAYHVNGISWKNGHGGVADDGVAEEREVFAACAAAALYRRDAVAAAHGFDENFFC